MSSYQKYMPVLDAIATMSKDPSTKVGCLIIDSRGAIRATGYNGFPRGVNDDPERYADREVKLNLVVHAETNAIANAAAVGTALQGCTMLVNKFPCGECAKMIINAGIVRVVAPDADDRWRASSDIAKFVFMESGVEWIKSI